MRVRGWTYIVSLAAACSSGPEDSAASAEAAFAEEVVNAAIAGGAESDGDFSVVGNIEEDGMDEHGDGIQTVRQAITGTHKVCSVVNPNHWRVSLVVDDGWGSNTCQQLCSQFSGSRVQLGCVFDNGFSFNSLNLCSGTVFGVPSPNCGW